MPNPAALEDGPLDAMLAQADQYALKNPQNYRDIIDRYRLVLSKANGTAQGDVVNRKIDDVVGRHQAALRQALEQYESKMNESLRAGNPQEAYDVWKDFPPNLRARESDQQIRQMLERAMPAGFIPK
jgi:hypothetical protein